MPREPFRSEPAEFVLGQFVAAAAAAFLPHHDGIEFAGVIGVQISREKPIVTASANCDEIVRSRSSSGTSSGPAA